MKLSVALCTHNGARYLQQQLDSIAAQTLMPDEMVVCDDHSTDETLCIIEAFALTSPFPVRLYVNDERLGPTQNFAKAISLCEGDVIALSDQDDVWRPGKLARLMSELASRPDVGLVFSDAEIVDGELRPLGYRAWECEWVEFGAREQQLFRDGRALEVLLTRNIITGAATAFRSRYRDLILPIPDISSWGLHDHWIALLIASVSKLAYVSESLLDYRHHAGQYIGLPPPRTEPRLYPVKAFLFELLRGRLSERGVGGRARRPLSRLGHLEARHRIAQSPLFARAWVALGELSGLRYHRYSGGLRSAVYDVMPYRAAQIHSLVARLVPFRAKRDQTDLPRERFS